MLRLLLLLTAIGLVVAVFLAAGAVSRRERAAHGADPSSSLALIQPDAVRAPAAPVASSGRATSPRAGSARAATPAPAPSAGAPMPGASRMILVVDPETRTLGLPPAALDRALTAEEMQDLARAEAAGLVTVQNADGSETLNHEGRFADHSIVRVGPDGKPVYSCVHGEGQLAHALHATPKAHPAAEEE